jgi:2-hydroxychromene-2-carboxylate isomerase
MASRTIRFYFDYESPNAYLAWISSYLSSLCEQLYRRAVPVLYAGLLDAHGQLAPGKVSAKGRWMAKNFLRKAAALGIQLNPPAFLPFNPPAALRATLAAADRGEVWRFITEPLSTFIDAWAIPIVSLAIVPGPRADANHCGGVRWPLG